MTQYFLIALSLVFILEGILPFLSPRMWRRTLLVIAMQPDRGVRMVGLCSMLFGVVLLYIVH